MPQNQNRHLFRGEGIGLPTAGRVITAVTALTDIHPQPMLLRDSRLGDSDAPEVLAKRLDTVIGRMSVIASDIPASGVVGSIRAGLFNTTGSRLARAAYEEDPAIGQITYSASNAAGELVGSLTPIAYGHQNGRLRRVAVEVDSSSMVLHYNPTLHGSLERHEELKYGLHVSAIRLGLTTFMQDAQRQPGVEQLHIGPANNSLIQSIAFGLEQLAANPQRAIDTGDA